MAFCFQRLARTEIDIALVAVAAGMRCDARQRCTDVRIALGAVAPCPMRALRAETVLEGQFATNKLIWQAAEMASQGIAPITDLRASAEYRREIATVLTRRALEDCVQRLSHKTSAHAGSGNGGAR
jgi:carbon-monoxide dehydrogenase medium subunit